MVKSLKGTCRDIREGDGNARNNCVGCFLVSLTQAQSYLRRETLTENMPHQIKQICGHFLD